LEQRLVDRVVEHLPTKRRWQVEEIVEAGHAGWVASTAEGNVRYLISLTLPVRSAEVPPAATIAWELVAEVSHRDADRLRLPLGAIMLGTGICCGVLTWHFRPPVFWIFVATLAGVFPVGVILGIVALRPLAARRHRGPVPAGDAFLEEYPPHDPRPSVAPS
jgi:hypothetical protein